MNKVDIDGFKECMESIAMEFYESETFANDVAIQDSLDRHLALSMEDKFKNRL